MNKKIYDEIVFIGASRSPIGKYLGSLKEISLKDLASKVLKSTVEKFNIDKSKIDEVIIGNVIGSQTSSNLARVVSIDSGLEVSSTAYTVNRICGSGLQSSINAYQDLLLGKRKLIASGGAESLSRAPYYFPEDSRYKPYRFGHFNILDSNLLLHETSSGSNSNIKHMGITAENIINETNISREDQDRFAFDSHMKAIKAFDNGRLSQEISPIELSTKSGEITIFDTDEQIRRDTTIERLSKLRSVFKNDGSVTAGNSSALNDGASFQIMTTLEYAKKHDYEIMGKFIDYTIVGLEPERMGLGPAYAINQLLKDNDLTLDEIDILEINEAFSGQVLACMKILGFDMNSDIYLNRLNVNGGAVALGHPLGMSGSRLITTILYEFRNNPNKRYAIASACIGGGQGIAILLENGYHGEKNEF